MAERRFSEDEVAQILKRAVEIQDSGTSLIAPKTGLTLAELQDIGREVGVAPEVMAQAARSVSSTVARPIRSVLGLPLGVGRSVELDRKLTDAEWDRLVVTLRETFDARGMVRSEGSLRSWTNGNLQALLEPTDTGQRLRLRTVNGSAQAWISGAVAMFGLSAVMAIAAVAKGTVVEPGFITSLATMVGLGASMFGVSALRLPRWADTRRRQMDEIAERVTSLARDLQLR